MAVNPHLHAGTWLWWCVGFANTLEFIGARGGDCEDYSISKYYTLMDLECGRDEAAARLRQSGALQTVPHGDSLFANPKSDQLVLDNINSRIPPGRQRIELIPVYSLDAKSGDASTFMRLTPLFSKKEQWESLLLWRLC